MTRRKPKREMAWRIEVEDPKSLVRHTTRARSCSDYDKAVRISLQMARDAKEPVIMKSRTHTLRVTETGDIVQLQPIPGAGS